MEVAEERKQPLPDWYLEEPELQLGEQFFLEAFWELHTSRPQAFGPGQIPWHLIRLYAVDCGLEPDVMDSFKRIIREADNAYLDWVEKDQKKNKGK